MKWIETIIKLSALFCTQKLVAVLQLLWECVDKGIY
ncbi:hypothetical protein R5R35_004399 [Gryllus longicercus]|uniref:Uncharacterized protein n=1 Tax=Gryllus longicercus TaxID=2509291 RepID=A0AAN9Z1T7_9ORTH